MNEIDRMLSIYRTSLSNKIAKLALPLETHFGIDEFIYTYIGEDGQFYAISNQPAPSEFYFSNQFFKSTLLIRHPNTFEEEAILPAAIPQEKQFKQMDEKFGYSPDNLLALFRKEKGCVHKFLFNTNKKDVSLLPFYVNNLELLKLFCDHFLKEWTPYWDEVQKHIINIAPLIGPSFYDSPQLTDPEKDVLNKVSFMKKIGALPKDFTLPRPFSKQEQTSLQWIYKGKTVKETALEMDLSPRTIESYLENVKNKLGCFTKSEVIDQLHLLKTLGVF